MATRLFISFDYDHDDDLRVMLLGQAKNDDSPFEVADYSLKVPLSGDWQEKIRPRIKGVDQVCVLCGQHTAAANGVAAEVTIAQEEKKPYFLLAARSGKVCQRPTTARDSDKLYTWDWPNLKALLAGGR